MLVPHWAGLDTIHRSPGEKTCEPRLSGISVGELSIINSAALCSPLRPGIKS